MTAVAFAVPAGSLGFWERRLEELGVDGAREERFETEVVAFKDPDGIFIELVAEAFNLFNTTNIRFFNTVYGASDFCPSDPTAFGCAGSTQFFQEGSPNPLYGTPRAVLNPRQIQLALKVSF